MAVPKLLKKRHDWHDKKSYLHKYTPCLYIFREPMRAPSFAKKEGRSTSELIGDMRFSATTLLRWHPVAHEINSESINFWALEESQSVLSYLS